jgi:DNA-binding LytR/AlgR family response regulator
MPKTLKALLVDDDPDASAWLAYTLNQRFPDLEISARDIPDLSGIFDIYFIDNDFHGKRLAAELATAIRAANPPAMIIAFSARLDSQSLKMLVNAGCDGACEKSEPADVEQMMRIVAAYQVRRQCEDVEQSQCGLMKALHSIRNLLREWNRRLDGSRA